MQDFWLLSATSRSWLGQELQGTGQIDVQYAVCVFQTARILQAGNVGAVTTEARHNILSSLILAQSSWQGQQAQGQRQVHVLHFHVLQEGNHLGLLFAAFLLIPETHIGAKAAGLQIDR